MKFLLATIFLMLCACGSKSNSDGDGTSLITDPTVLAQRIRVPSSTLDLVEAGVALTAPAKKVESDLVLTLVGEIDPPTLGKSQLQATDVFIAKNKAIVAYNMAGEDKLGAIDLVNIKSAEKPDLDAQLAFSDRDVNALTFREGYIYTTGSWKADGPSFLSKVRVRGGTLTTEHAEVSLPGYAGTDVIANSSTINVTTGDNSGLHRVTRKSFSLETSLKIADARSVAQNSEKDFIWVLSGQPGKLSQFSSSGELKDEFSIGGATIAQSKSTVQAGKKWTIAAVGDGGILVTCNSDGKVISKIPVASVSGIAAEKTVTNAATAEGGYLFAANGEAGVYVFKMTQAKEGNADCSDIAFQLIGSIDFGKALSANHVTVQRDILYVGDGLGGLKIVTLKRTKDKTSQDVSDFDHEDDENEDCDREFDD